MATQTKIKYGELRKHMNKAVRIKTKSGSILYGKIIKVNDGKLYLQVTGVHPKGSKSHATFAPLIIPLVLFDLLAIFLIGRRRRIIWK
ncbi:hypothetical protein D3C78_1720800 [compost metagenome]